MHNKDSSASVSMELAGYGHGYGYIPRRTSTKRSSVRARGPSTAPFLFARFFFYM